MNKKWVVFVVPCMLAPGLQASYDLEREHWGKQFIQLFMDNNIDIMPLVCVEASFKGYENGVKRKKHGIDFYSKEDGFCDHCRIEAEKTAQKIRELKQAGYCVLGILGVEHSPSCAINYLYSCRGTIKTSGLFMSSLKETLIKEELDVEFIGINRKYPGKTLERIAEILDDYC